MHHTKTIGDIAELKVASKYIERGFIVSKPLTDHASYDLVIDNGKDILKVQVKARSINKGVVTIQKYTSNKEYNKGDFDILAVYCIDNEQIAQINWNDFITKDLKLRIEDSKNNQSKKINYFKDYLI